MWQGASQGGGHPSLHWVPAVGSEQGRRARLPHTANPQFSQRPEAAPLVGSARHTREPVHRPRRAAPVARAKSSTRQPSKGPEPCGHPEGQSPRQQTPIKTMLALLEPLVYHVCLCSRALLYQSLSCPVFTYPLCFCQCQDCTPWYAEKLWWRGIEMVPTCLALVVMHTMEMYCHCLSFSHYNYSSFDQQINWD